MSSGAAYVFVRDDLGQWMEEAYLKASNADDSDLFGGQVSISGDTIAIGVPNENSNGTGVNGDQSNNDANNSGAVYLFDRDASGLSLIHI